MNTKDLLQYMLIFKDLKLQDLADFCGVHEQTANRWICHDGKQRREPRKGTPKHIAEFFGFSYDQWLAMRQVDKPTDDTDGYRHATYQRLLTIAAEVNKVPSHSLGEGNALPVEVARRPILVRAPVGTHDPIGFKEFCLGDESVSMSALASAILAVMRHGNLALCDTAPRVRTHPVTHSSLFLVREFLEPHPSFAEWCELVSVLPAPDIRVRSLPAGSLGLCDDVFLEHSQPLGIVYTVHLSKITDTLLDCVRFR